jgi:hypothetical protein
MADVTDWRSMDANDWAIAIAALLGLWVVASPFVYGVGEAMLWNAVIVGALVAVVGGYNVYRREDTSVVVSGASLVALLGLWLLASPFVLAVPADGMFWSSAVVGAMIALLGGYNAYVGWQRRRSATAAEGTV